MRMKRTALRGTAVSPPIASVAQAEQQTTNTAKLHAKKHAARVHHPMRSPSAANRRELYGAAPSAETNWPGCTWPYTNQEPPCMGTFPAGDPNYHGSRHGPIFDQPF